MKIQMCNHADAFDCSTTCLYAPKALEEIAENGRLVSAFIGDLFDQHRFYASMHKALINAQFFIIKQTQGRI